MNEAGNLSDTAVQPELTNSWTGYSSSILSSPTEKMDFLHAQLAQQGIASEGMSWSLLLLEWKYDLAVLFGNLGNWMRYIDQHFYGPGE